MTDKPDDQNPLNGDGSDKRERCVVIHPHVKTRGTVGRDPDARLDEMVGLALAIGVEIAHAGIVTLNRVKPSTLFGKARSKVLAALFQMKMVKA